MAEHVPGRDPEVLADGLDVREVVVDPVPAVPAAGLADAALVEADAPKLGEERRDVALHGIRHPGPTVEQQDRIPVRPALAYRERRTGAVDRELTHRVLLRLRVRPGGQAAAPASSASPKIGCPTARRRRERTPGTIRAATAPIASTPLPTSTAGCRPSTNCWGLA